MVQNEFNPYVGPRPFERDEKDARRFFGRSQETQEIVSFIFGHPVTLVYAQSGAGKTSLFNASITRTLEKKGFEVLPLTRVGGAVPQGIGLQEIKNLYIFNALLKMDVEADTRTLLLKTLSDFLKTRVRMVDQINKPRPQALIFDQFEELFTYTPEDWREQRKGFFLQVVEALKADPLLRVVFVIREDFLAELDPYAHDLPERLRIRYRLERLGREAALRAIKDPIVSTTRKFAPGVADELVKQLLSTRTVDATGKMTEIEGQYAEPVQLQVACVTLWSSLDPKVTEIQQVHLQNFKVDDALSDFYRSAIEEAVRKTGVQEANLRNWFGKTLITSMGTRSTVFRGEDSTGGIDNKTVDFLENLHIIRAEFRAGARWYELTHDRLVEPILANNKNWFNENLSLWEQQAALWVAQGRGDGLLLQGVELKIAERETRSTILSDDVQAFLKACQSLQRRRTTAWIITSFVVVAMAILSVVALHQSQIAREAAQFASAERFATLAMSKSQTELVPSLLLGVEAYRILDNPDTRGALLDVASASPYFLQPLYGHFDSVISVAFNPDGKILASGGQDNKIILWDVATRQPIGVPLERHKGQVQSLTFSPDGKILASGGDDDIVILWDVQTHKPIGQPLMGHTDSVYSVAFSPDGKILASGSWDDTIILWDVATHLRIGKPLVGHKGDVYSVAFSPDGKILASGSVDTTILLWDVTTQSPIGEPLQANGSHVECVVFSPDGSILASAGFDNTITLWDTFTRQQKGLLKGHSNWVATLVFDPGFDPNDPNNDILASGSADGTIILWNLATKQPRDRLTGAGSLVRSIAFSPDGKTLVSGDLDNAIIFWNLDSDLNIGQRLTVQKGRINSVVVSENGKYLASGSDDGTFALWDASLLKPFGSPHPYLGKFVETLAFNPNSNLLAAGGYSTGIILWDMENNERKTLLKTDEKAYDYVYSLAFSPDGETLASGNLEDSIILWDMTAPDTPMRIGIPLEGHEPSTGGVFLKVTSLAFSPDGKLLASGSEDQTVILWDMATRTPLARFKGHTGPVYSVAFSPDGTVLASAGFDRNIILWDAKTFQKIGQTLTGHFGSVQALAFSSDGKILASGGADQSIILWDLTTKRRIGGPLNNNGIGIINSLAFSSDSKTLFSAGNDLIAWNLDPHSWLDSSCQRAGRNFTRAEWEQYFPGEEYRKTCDQWPLESEVADPTP